MDVLDAMADFTQRDVLQFCLAVHLVTFDLEVDVGEQAECKLLCDAAATQWAAEVKALMEAGAPDTIKYEPGIRVYPAKVCSWILNDKSETKSDGKP
ncbi:hypothetical protein ON010_g12204 [Phytophthora cinnamomi]|nr:hypothetical protein ON010_g12204 [Phytophthora cinnamomi]